MLTEKAVGHFRNSDESAFYSLSCPSRAMTFGAYRNDRRFPNMGCLTLPEN